jgi:REP element-mobilizing transposase RayT
MFCGAFPARYSFGVYAYCFMPDHLHLIVTGESESSELPGGAGV